MLRGVGRPEEGGRPKPERKVPCEKPLRARLAILTRVRSQSKENGGDGRRDLRVAFGLLSVKPLTVKEGSVTIQGNYWRVSPRLLQKSDHLNHGRRTGR